MFIHRPPSRRYTALAAAALAMTAALLRPTSAAPPSTQPTGTRTDADIVADLKRVGSDLTRALPGDAISDPAKRAAAAPAAIPLLKQQAGLYREYGVAHQNEAALAPLNQRVQSQLYLLGDRDTVDQVDHAAGSSTESQSVPARVIQLQSRWTAAGHDAAAQAAVASDLAKLDHDRPTNIGLTQFTFSIRAEAVTPALKGQLLDMATGMDNALATRLKAMAPRILEADKDQAESEGKLNGLTGKPLALNATTVDGQPFSIDAYKGKVVLVDFWATWCGPCKAGLPEVKEIYGKYHDKGLEIVGVSNDYKADTLKQFTAANDMPWVQLLDAPAAAENKWNPTTLGYGIRGIPTMFLVDRKGICRTVEARETMQQLIPELLAEK